MPRDGVVGSMWTNAAVTATTLREHLTDDPVVFWLQVARRLPDHPVRLASRLLLRSRPRLLKYWDGKTPQRCSSTVPSQRT